jgi:predicted DNA-binding protein
MQAVSRPPVRSTTSVTIKPHLLDKLKEEAGQQGRTVSNLIERIIEHHFAQPPSAQ